MTHDVFITYSSKDRATGDAVCAALEAREIDCWIAPRNLLPGRSWGGAIIEALEQSRFLVLVYTSNSNNSQQVLREIERAVSKNITIIPLRLDITPLSTDLEYFLSSCQWMEAVSPPLEKHLEELADVVDRLLGKKKRAEPLDRFTPKSIPAAAIPAAAKRPTWLLPAVAAAIAILCIALFFLFRKPDSKKASIEKQAVAPLEESARTPVVQKVDQKPAAEVVQIPVIRKVAQKPIVDEIIRKPAEGAVRIPVVHKVAQK
ncbi:MAG: toll/interleukin-1 receptor domain-containing protein, partial [Desulfobulbaceae bacterium]|nr:toll/interleukin-1 receptor domain-containing protein [Desulfobulbaceae bacterium]